MRSSPFIAGRPGQTLFISTAFTSARSLQSKTPYSLKKEYMVYPETLTPIFME